jgi:hypothetical protein
MRQNFCHHIPEEQVAGLLHNIREEQVAGLLHHIREEQVASLLSRERGWSCTIMFYCDADVLKEKHFCIKFVVKLVTVPQKYTGYNNKHSDIEL